MNEPGRASFELHPPCATGKTLLFPVIGSPVAQIRAPSLPSSVFVKAGINATPLGMKPADLLPVDPEQLDDSTLVADIVMKPPFTRLLKQAQARGLAVHRGCHMLDHQLAAYFEFFGLKQLAQTAAGVVASMKETA